MSLAIYEMANRLAVTENEWRILFPIWAAQKHVYIGAEVQCRRFMDAVLWVLRSGHNGACCQKRMENGTVYSSDSPVGVSEAFGTISIATA